MDVGTFGLLNFCCLSENQKKETNFSPDGIWVNYKYK